jgi:hypothetical protein
VAYRLDLPSTTWIHHVFHVSQLKKAVGSQVQVSPTLPPELTSFPVPEKILRKRLIVRGIRIVLQALVKWSSWPTSLATWEDVEALKQRFSNAPAWGQATPNGGGNVIPNAAMKEEVAPSVEAGTRRTSTRPRHPNVRVNGPEWAG